MKIMWRLLLTMKSNIDEDYVEEGGLRLYCQKIKERGDMLDFFMNFLSYLKFTVIDFYLFQRENIGFSYNPFLGVKGFKFL